MTMLEPKAEVQWACARCELRLPESKIPKRVRGEIADSPRSETDQAGFHDRRFRWIETKHGYVVYHDDQWRPIAENQITVGPLCGPLFPVAEYDPLAGLDEWDVLRGVIRTGLLRSMDAHAVDRVMGKLERRVTPPEPPEDRREWMCGSCLCLYRFSDDLPPTAEGCGARQHGVEAYSAYVHSCPISRNPDQPLAAVSESIARCGAAHGASECRRPAGHGSAGTDAGHRAIVLGTLVEWDDTPEAAEEGFFADEPYDVGGTIVWAARRLPRPSPTWQYAKQRAHAYRGPGCLNSTCTAARPCRGFAHTSGELRALCGVERPRRVESPGNLESITRCRTCERLAFAYP